MAAYACAHCGQKCGDYDGGFASVSNDEGTFYLCHPNAPGRPDCYRRVTVYREAIGALMCTKGPQCGP